MEEIEVRTTGWCQMGHSRLAPRRSTLIGVSWLCMRLKISSQRGAGNLGGANQPSEVSKDETKQAVRDRRDRQVQRTQTTVSAHVCVVVS